MATSPVSPMTDLDHENVDYAQSDVNLSYRRVMLSTDDQTVLLQAFATMYISIGNGRQIPGAIVFRCTFSPGQTFIFQREAYLLEIQLGMMNNTVILQQRQHTGHKPLSVEDVLADLTTLKLSDQ